MQISFQFFSMLRLFVVLSINNKIIKKFWHRLLKY